MSVFLTDAPGDVAAVWVDVSEMYLQGEEGRVDLLTEPTGLIELISLQGTSQEIVDGAAVEAQSFGQLRFVLASAVLETEDGQVYAFGDGAHPGGLEITGELVCPSCTTSGLKAILGGSELEVEEGQNSLLLDFDVSRSFGRQAGNAGRWIMRPTIHASRMQGDDAMEDAAGIEGIVALAEGVQIPECPTGTPRDITEFIPLATAQSLTDEGGAAIIRSGETDGDGSFEIDPLDADDYALSFEATVDFASDRLVFEATADPSQVSVGDGQRVEDVAFTITTATCEAVAGG